MGHRMKSSPFCFFVCAERMRGYLCCENAAALAKLTVNGYQMREHHMQFAEYGLPLLGRQEAILLHALFIDIRDLTLFCSRVFDRRVVDGR